MARLPFAAGVFAATAFPSTTKPVSSTFATGDCPFGDPSWKLWNPRWKIGSTRFARENHSAALHFWRLHWFAARVGA